MGCDEPSPDRSPAGYRTRQTPSLQGKARGLSDRVVTGTNPTGALTRAPRPDAGYACVGSATDTPRAAACSSWLCTSSQILRSFVSGMKSPLTITVITDTAIA